jgi:hypothetical protein
VRRPVSGGSGGVASCRKVPKVDPARVELGLRAAVRGVDRPPSRRQNKKPDLSQQLGIICTSSVPRSGVIIGGNLPALGVGSNEINSRASLLRCAYGISSESSLDPDTMCLNIEETYYRLFVGKQNSEDLRVLQGFGPRGVEEVGWLRGGIKWAWVVVFPYGSKAELRGFGIDNLYVMRMFENGRYGCVRYHLTVHSGVARGPYETGDVFVDFSTATPFEFDPLRNEANQRVYRDFLSTRLRRKAHGGDVAVFGEDLWCRWDRPAIVEPGLHFRLDWSRPAVSGRYGHFVSPSGCPPVGILLSMGWGVFLCEWTFVCRFCADEASRDFFSDPVSLCREG